MTAAARRPLVIVVRDGWGKNPDVSRNASNAVHLARRPVHDRLLAECPHAMVATSGFDVGLPEGTMGNSEVGHQNIGAGRIVDQESVRITKQVRNGEFLSNPAMNAAVDRAVARGSDVHVFGIVSDAGVHGQLEHLYGVLRLCKARGMARTFVHAFTDGRDTPPNKGLEFVRQAEAAMREIGCGRIASVSGRYYAMDRDNRWPRVERAYRAIAFADGPRFPTAGAIVQHYYDHPSAPNMTGDEFVTPSVVTDDAGQPLATVKPGDSVIFYNYRGDRPRELTKAFVDPAFNGFDRGPLLDLHFVTMTAYEAGLPVHVAYPKPPKMLNTLGEYVATLGLRQFRCAETEKFPHVTFFFNDYREPPFPGEDRQIVPSPTVSTYDQMPEMSAYGIADETVKRIDSGLYDLVVVNFANCDMVGHTGVLAAAVKAVEHTDVCVGRVLDAVRRAGGVAIVGADHGNCEQMLDPETGLPHTAHTTFPVEYFLVDDRLKGKRMVDGRLADVAPTALEMMGLSVPAEMTGHSLIAKSR